MDGLTEVVAAPIAATGHVAQVVTEPVRSVSDSVESALTTHIRDLAAALEITNQTAAQQRDAIGRIETQIGDIANHITSTTANVATAGIESAGDVVHVVSDAPEAAANTVEAVVESPTAAPIRKPKGMLGAMKKTKGRR